jgi:hypothetical protein
MNIHTYLTLILAWSYVYTNRMFMAVIIAGIGAEVCRSTAVWKTVICPAYPAGLTFTTVKTALVTQNGQ